jgi:hypothetical protein
MSATMRLALNVLLGILGMNFNGFAPGVKIINAFACQFASLRPKNVGKMPLLSAPA